MSFKLRLEFPGACYHVINRGNYRNWIFQDVGSKTAFEACMLEGCERSGWLLHGFVVMGNHYHLAVETPLGNLSAGMQWLQSTFANRFNRLRGVRGHLFQGRFKALLVEPGDALGQVCHYIHLNPVRAGIVPVAELTNYRWSSYWGLQHPAKRPRCLRVEAPLVAAGDLPDTRQGWKCYADYLEWQSVEGPAGKNLAYTSMSRGWILGSEGFKQQLLSEHALALESLAWAEDGLAQVKAARWERALALALTRVPRQDRQSVLPSASWKVAVAMQLKQDTDIPNGWLAQRLGMGSACYVSKLVGLARQRAQSAQSAANSQVQPRNTKGKA
jgi:putative transposase